MLSERKIARYQICRLTFKCHPCINSEPLANYRQVKTAVKRINEELGIGARRITISTVGIVPNIRKLYQDAEMPPVRLAVSLHCATDEERSALLPAKPFNLNTI